MGLERSATPSRPALRYMGGKWRLAPRIIAHFPPHRTYVEPFGGAASILLRKERSFQEIYNDLDGEIVALFRVLRDPPSAARLAELIALTPFARAEFELSYEPSPDLVENARRTVVRSFMGFGSTATALRRRTGFRGISERNGKHPARDFAGLPEAICQICARLAGVVLENRPAISVMKRCDGPRTLIYADPPYLHGSRSAKRIHGALEHAYAHEMSDGDHAELLAWLTCCRSMVVLSGYASPAYDAALAEWKSVEIPARADGGRPRRERLWINPAARRASGDLLAWGVRRGMSTKGCLHCEVWSTVLAHEAFTRAGDGSTQVPLDCVLEAFGAILGDLIRDEPAGFVGTVLLRLGAKIRSRIGDHDSGHIVAAPYVAREIH
jgi:DNA adenine methylase